jgi:REP element-mobilizing transposase RayT
MYCWKCGSENFDTSDYCTKCEETLGAHVSSHARSDADEDIGAPGYGWHARGYLPHFDSDCVIQMITYRLADSLPKDVLERLADETDTAEGNAAYRKRIEAWMDAGHGECLLREEWVAQLVEDSFRLFDGTRYELHTWVIMPNHVHMLVRVLSPHTLSDLVKGWKSFTARRINQQLSRQGTVWQKEYWDRYIRDERHYVQAMAYIHENPVKAGLVVSPEDWRWSSASGHGCPHVCE